MKSHGRRTYLSSGTLFVNCVSGMFSNASRVSLFYLVGLYDLWDGLRTLLISSLGTYAIALYVEGPYMPWIGFVFVMSHMSINHLHRQFVNQPSTVDIT